MRRRGPDLLDGCREKSGHGRPFWCRGLKMVAAMKAFSDAAIMVDRTDTAIV
jgi:hypothetical protein